MAGPTMTPEYLDRKTGDYCEREAFFSWHKGDPGDPLIDATCYYRVPEGMAKTILGIWIPVGAGGVCTVSTFKTDDIAEVAMTSWATAVATAAPWIYTIRNVRWVELKLTGNNHNFHFLFHSETVDN